jgi:hypothetical protein
MQAPAPASPMQHWFLLRSQGVRPHRTTPLSVNAGPSALAASALASPPEEEATPLPLLPPDAEEEDGPDEEELEPPLPAPSATLPPVEASELATPLDVPPHPYQARAAQTTSAARSASTW